jgi:predicted nucleic acid-binding protein
LIVVSNTSALVGLAVLGRFDLLQSLYGGVLVPEAVWNEFVRIGSRRSDIQASQKVSCVTVESVSDRSLVRALSADVHTGEAEAIALAVERRADLLLVDDRRARRAALRLGLKVLGLLALLIEAKRRGLIHAVKPLLDQLIAKADFWISAELYAMVLREACE